MANRTFAVHIRQNVSRVESGAPAPVLPSFGAWSEPVADAPRRRRTVGPQSSRPAVSSAQATALR
jgi:hypothetical protein